jgi:Protein of unknown function (DUF3558)
VGRGLLVGVIVVAGVVAGCGHTDRGAASSATLSPSGGAPAVTTTSTRPTSTRPVASGTRAANAVRSACGKSLPPVVVQGVPGAAATYTAHFAFGSNCQWHTDDLTRRALAVAVTVMPYRNYQRLQPMLAGHTSVAGYQAVRGHVEGGCTVLVDVDDVALDVELTGVADAGCQTTTTLAGQILVGR